jgi:hypothetical protein
MRFTLKSLHGRRRGGKPAKVFLRGLPFCHARRDSVNGKRHIGLMP